MERNIAKQVFTKDSKKRITVYYDEDGINPMETTDFPLHCEDWVRGYTIATGKHSSNYGSSARGLLEWVLDNHADSEKAIDYLIKAGKDEKHFGLDDYLIYNRSAKRWELWSDGYDELWFDKRDKIDWLAITGRLTDETIDFMVSEFLCDTIKMCEYSFNYYSGGVSFGRGKVTCESDGIAYIEKDEVLKYCGHDERRKNASLVNGRNLIRAVASMMKTMLLSMQLQTLG